MKGASRYRHDGSRKAWRKHPGCVGSMATKFMSLVFSLSGRLVTSAIGEAIRTSCVI